MDASDKGLPSQMNLAIRSSGETSQNQFSKDARTAHQLKQQNKLLTDVSYVFFSLFF